jgi:general secretion pathway protein G
VLTQIRSALRNENGFTLIELLMVIVILGILSGIVVFAVGGITDKGQTSACKADLSTVATAEEAYYANNDTHAYATGAQLVTAGFLHSFPDATVSVDPATGAVTGKGKCASVTI